MRDDADLLALWQGGDREAGDELIKRHFSAVLGFFRRKLGHDVEDLVQHTFMDCCAHVGDIESARFRVFLFTIAHRRLMDRLRQTYRRSDAETLSSTMADLATSPRGLVARNQEAQLLLEALDNITLEERLVIELAHFEELKGPEIAEVLGIPANTVRSRLSRARGSLKVEVEALANSPNMAKAILSTLVSD